MENIFYRWLKRIYVIWVVWSCLFAGVEITKQRIPMKVHLYEEDAKEVLSGSQEKIAPEQYFIGTVPGMLRYTVLSR